jgi:hypothetical protein
MCTQERFVRNIAAGMLAGDWTAAGLRTSIYRATRHRYGWAASLSKRLFAAHPQPPAFADLVHFLQNDKGFVRGSDRIARAPTAEERFPIWHIYTEPAAPPPPPPSWATHLPAIPNEQALAALLGVPLPQLLWLADPGGRNRRHPIRRLRTYRHRWVAKPGGRERLLEIPSPLLMRTQRKLLEVLLNHVPAHPAAHGFCRGRSVVTNVSPHCGRTVVIRFDLTDFFPSVPVGRVFATFRTLGYPDTVARLLGSLCTTALPGEAWSTGPNPAADGADHATRVRLNARHLPQGAPTSPMVANLVAFHLDRRLAGLAAAVGATYTRYADDLTFSGGEDLRRSANRFARRVVLIAAEEGSTVNRGKTRVLGRAGRQTVTGVVVNARPNIPRGEFDRFKAILTNCVRHGPSGQNRERVPDFRAHLAGCISHVASVNPTRGRELWALYDRIAWPAANEEPADDATS